MTEATRSKIDAMPEALLVVTAVVDPAVERDWSDWYDSKHLPEILACPHFEAGARYVAEDQGGRRYITVYRLSSKEAVHTPEFAHARGWQQFDGRVESTTRLYSKLAPRQS